MIPEHIGYKISRNLNEGLGYYFKYEIKIMLSLNLRVTLGNHINYGVNNNIIPPDLDWIIRDEIKSPDSI